MTKEGVLLRQDMTFVWNAEIADGVVVELGTAVGGGARGDRWTVNSGRAEVAMGGISAGI